MSPTHSPAVIRSISATAMPIFDGLFLACGSSAVAVAPTRVMSLRAAKPTTSKETQSPVDANANLASNSSDVPAAYRCTVCRFYRTKYHLVDRGGWVRNSCPH